MIAGMIAVAVGARCDVKILCMTFTLMVSPTNSLTLVSALNILYHAAIAIIVGNLNDGRRKRCDMLVKTLVWPFSSS